MDQGTPVVEMVLSLAAVVVEQDALAEAARGQERRGDCDQ
jgi:hypothetical protein